MAKQNETQVTQDPKARAEAMVDALVKKAHAA